MHSARRAQPWQSWVVLILALWCAYQIYGSATWLIQASRPEVLVVTTPMMDVIVRLAALPILIAGAMVLMRQRGFALPIIVAGTLLYTAPWLYRYGEAIASVQPQHYWHIAKTYPQLTWQHFLLPVVMAVLSVVAARRISANNTVETDARNSGARGSLRTLEHNGSTPPQSY
jgi:hypothetical protein